MRIQLQPGQNILLKNVYMPAKNVFQSAEAFKKLVEDNWSVELFWFPFNNKSLLPFTHYDPLEDDLIVRVINFDKTGHAVEPEQFYETQAKWDWITAQGMLASQFLYVDHPGRHILVKLLEVR